MVIANFEQGQRKKTVSDKLKQWDYGQVLRIQGLHLPTAVEVHFSLQESRGDCVNRIGVTKDGVTDVVIPDSMVENEGATGKEYYIYAWVYLTDETSGHTEYEIKLSVETRSKPEAFDKPEDAEIFREAIKAVSECADRAEEAAKKEVTDGRIDEAVTEYLDENGIKTDKTLTVDGGIADAKATGEALDKKASINNAVFTGSISMGRKEGSDIGENSVAIGDNVEASGKYSYAEGSYNTASGESSHAEGAETTASGSYSHAEGFKTTVTDIGISAHAEGANTTASGSCSHAEGFTTSASNSGCHSEGIYTTASGKSSHAEGDGTTASGSYSHAEGYNTETSGLGSHAEGHSTKASGSYSHAEGYNTETSGLGSHAEGSSANASGQHSHAEGYFTTASGECSHAQGKYNIEDTEGKYAHIVGNGSYKSRSNAHTVDWEGNAWYAGKLSQEGTPTEDKDLTTKGYVDTFKHFIAEYNVTPTDDVIDAYNKGLEIIVKRPATSSNPAHYARLTRADGYGVTPNLTFTCEENGVSHHYHINGDGWNYWNYNLDQTDNISKLLPLLPLLTSAYNSFRGGFVSNAGTLHITDPGIYLILQAGSDNKNLVITQNGTEVLNETYNGIIIMAYDGGVITPIGIKASLTLSGTIKMPGTYQGWTNDGSYSTTINYPAQCVISYLGNSNVNYLE